MSDSATSISRLIRHAAKLNRAALEEVLRRQGITVSQFSVLRRLGDSHGGSWAADLAREMMVTPQVVQQVVAGLEEAQLVERRVDLVHGKIQRISLTRVGRRLLASCERAVQAVERGQTSCFTLDELEQLERLLRDYVDAARDQEAAS